MINFHFYLIYSPQLLYSFLPVHSGCFFSAFMLWIWKFVLLIWGLQASGAGNLMIDVFALGDRKLHGPPFSTAATNTSESLLFEEEFVHFFLSSKIINYYCSHLVVSPKPKSVSMELCFKFVMFSPLLINCNYYFIIIPIILISFFYFFLNSLITWGELICHASQRLLLILPLTPIRLSIRFYIDSS